MNGFMILHNDTLPGSRERVALLGEQYSAILAGGHEVSPFDIPGIET